VDSHGSLCALDGVPFSPVSNKEFAIITLRTTQPTEGWWFKEI
jgi:hypothetical protein